MSQTPKIKPTPRQIAGLAAFFLAFLFFVGDGCFGRQGGFFRFAAIFGLGYVGVKLLRPKKAGPQQAPDLRPHNAPQPRVAPRQPGKSKPAPAKRLVLLVDDNITIQKVVNITLAENQIEVRTCAPSDPVMILARQLQPAAAIIKHDRSGVATDLIRQLRRELPDVRIILLLSRENRNSLSPAERELADAVLGVPFESRNLRKALKTAMMARRQGIQMTEAAEAAPLEIPPPLDGGPVMAPPPLEPHPHEFPDGPSEILTTDNVIEPDELHVAPGPDLPAPAEPLGSYLENTPESPGPLEMEAEPEPEPGLKLLLLIAGDRALPAAVRAALPPGWTLGVCDNGRMAVEESLRLRPAVVAAVREAPGLPGIEVARAIKDERALAGVRCIVFKTEHEILDDFQAQMAGVDRVLNLPPDPDELRKALQA